MNAAAAGKAHEFVAELLALPWRRARDYFEEKSIVAGMQSKRYFAATCRARDHLVQQNEDRPLQHRCIACIRAGSASRWRVMPRSAATGAISSTQSSSSACPSQNWSGGCFVKAGDLAQEGQLLHEAIDQPKAILKDLMRGVLAEVFAEAEFDGGAQSRDGLRQAVE